MLQIGETRTRWQGWKEIQKTKKGTQKPSKACQGYQEGHRRYRRKEEIILLAIPISAYTFYAAGSKIVEIFIYLFQIVRT